jgi:hypothetical protein
MTNFNQSLICELTELKKLGIFIPKKTMETAETLSEDAFSGLRISEIADLLILTRGKI